MKSASKKTKPGSKARIKQVGSDAIEVLGEPKRKPQYPADQLREFGRLIDRAIGDNTLVIKQSRETLREVEIPRAVESNAEGNIRQEAAQQIQRAEKMLAHLLNAKGRISAGTFGICNSCLDPHLIDPSEMRLSIIRTKCVAAKKRVDPTEFVREQRMGTLVS